MTEFLKELTPQTILTIGLIIITIIVNISMIFKYFELCKCVKRMEIMQSHSDITLKQIAENTEKSNAKLAEISNKIGREERII